MSPDQRQHLAQQQAALVESLVARTSPPADFDPTQLATTADALLRKRTRGIEKSAPWLKTLLNDRYQQLLDSYLDAHPSPPPKGHVADAKRFVNFLLRCSRLSLSARFHLLGHKLRSFVRRR